MLKVYSIHECPWCDKVKKYLKSKGVDFEERNVEDNEDYAKECVKISGDLTVPVVTEDGKNFVLGFDKAKIDAMLNL